MKLSSNDAIVNSGSASRLFGGRVQYRREDDSAWQEFINRPASPETKFAPKYINSKTGK